MSKILFSLIFLSFVILTSCAENNTNPTNTSKELIPLKKGNYWVLSSNIRDYKYKFSCFDTYNYNQKDYMIMHYFRDYLKDEKPTEIVLWRNIDSGVVYGSLDSIEYLKYKFPINRGEIFTFYQTQITALTVDTTIKVMGKEFKNTIVYSSLEKPTQGNYFYQNVDYISVGFGLIKKETYQWDKTKDFSTKTLFETEELIEYNVK